MGHVIGIGGIPRILTKDRIIVSKRKTRMITGYRCSGARCVLPFGLREQPVFLASHPGKPFDIFFGLIPRDVNDRPFPMPKVCVSRTAIINRSAFASSYTSIPVIESH